MEPNRRDDHHDDASMSPEELTRLVFDGVPGLIAYVDSELKYVIVNGRYAAWYGMTKEEIVGRQIRDVLGDEPSYERTLPYYEAALRGEHVSFVNEQNRDGEKRFVSMEFTPRISPDGTVLGFFALIQDITSLRRAGDELRELNRKLTEQLSENEKLRGELLEQAIRDPLTGLFNRRYLEETLEREIAQSDREGSVLSVIMLDIDYFKAINDTFGHKAGDRILSTLGDILRKKSRKGDVACRYGGEEFLLVLPGSSIGKAAARAEAFREEFRNACVALKPVETPITLSAGIAAYPFHGRDADSLVEASDRALYAAKAMGRDRTVVQH